MCTEYNAEVTDNRLDPEDPLTATHDVGATATLNVTTSRVERWAKTPTSEKHKVVCQFSMLRYLILIALVYTHTPTHR